MSFRSGLVGIGLGAAFIGGGGYSLYEGLHEQHLVNDEKACTMPEYAGRAVCQNNIVTPLSIKDNSNEAKLFDVLGGIGIVGGVIGVAVAYTELDEADGRKENSAIPQQEVAAEAEG